MFKIEYIELNKKDKYEFSNNGTYIYGPNNVGKTLFYKTLDYILGQEKENIWNCIGMENVNIIDCKISNNDSTIFLQRNRKHNLFYKRNENDEYLLVDLPIYKEEIQKMIYQDKKLDEEYYDSVEEKLTYRGWSYLNFIDEHSLGHTSPIISKANSIQNYKRIHKQMNFIFDYNNLVKLNKLTKEIKEIEEKLEVYKKEQDKYNYLIELINHYLSKLNILNDGELSVKEERFNMYLDESKKKSDGIMIKNKQELTYLLKASAYLEEQIKIESAYEKQNSLVDTKNKKIDLLLSSLESVLKEKEQYSIYLKDIKDILEKNKIFSDIISLKDYSASIKNLKEQKKLIDIQLTNLKNSLKENNPEDVIKYISNLKTYFEEIKLIPNCGEYKYLNDLLNSKTKELNTVKKSLGKYNSNNINKFLTNNYLAMPVKADYVEEDKRVNKFELRFFPATLSINAFKEESFNGNTIETTYIPGSKARYTCWQLLGYLSLYSYIINKFKSFPILPLIVIDGFNEPFDDKSEIYKCLVEYFVELCTKLNMQIIIIASRNDINFGNMNYIDLSNGFNLSR